MSAAVPEGPSWARSAVPSTKEIPPPPTDGLGSKFTAGESRDILCELELEPEALLVTAEPDKREEKILAEASIGIQKAKEAPPKVSTTIKTFFTLEEGFVFWCFKISLLGARPAVSAIKWLC